MSDKPLQMTLFEPDMTATVEVTELYGSEPGGIFDFIGKDWKPATVTTCWGDLRVMVDALIDYAGILEKVIKEWGLTGYKAGRYELHAARCRKIAQKYADAIGYDRDAALKKCRKPKAEAKDDVGEEALTLSAMYGRRGTKPQSEPSTEAGEKAESQQGEQIFLPGIIKKPLKGATP